MVKRLSLLALLVATTLTSTEVRAQLLLMRRPSAVGLTEMGGAAMRVCSGDGRVCASKEPMSSYATVTETAGGHVLRELPLQGFLPPEALALSFDGSLLAYAGGSPAHAFEIYDLTTGRRVFARSHSLAALQQEPAALGFSADGTLFGYQNKLGEAEVWRTKSWNLLDNIAGLPSNSRTISFPDDKHASFYDQNGDGKVWTLGARQIAKAPSMPPSRQAIAAFAR
jgi:WD40 repeat protein